MSFSTFGALLALSSVNPETENGYVVGGGLEWGLSPLVSVKVEGDWYDFGSAAGPGGFCIVGTCSGLPVGSNVPSESTNTSRQMWEIKGGVNIHFNGPLGAVAARDWSAVLTVQTAPRWFVGDFYFGKA